MDRVRLQAPIINDIGTISTNSQKVLAFHCKYMYTLQFRLLKIFNDFMSPAYNVATQPTKY